MNPTNLRKFSKFNYCSDETTHNYNYTPNSLIDFSFPYHHRWLGLHILKIYRPAVITAPHMKGVIKVLSMTSLMQVLQKWCLQLLD